MKTHGLDFIGYIIVQRVEGLPTFNAETDYARLIYDTIDDKIYKGDVTGWNEVIDINSELLVHRVASLPSFDASQLGRVLYNEDDGYLYRGKTGGWVKLVDGDDTRLIEHYNTLPDFDDTKDVGRVVYNEEDGKLYLGKEDEWFQMDIEVTEPYEHPTDIQCQHTIADHTDAVGSTDSRATNSETYLLQAKAMFDHISSDDHDGRYYTQNEVDNLISLATSNVSGNYVSKSGDVMSGSLIADNSSNNSIVRNIRISTSMPTSAEGDNGDIWLKV